MFLLQGVETSSQTNYLSFIVYTALGSLHILAHLNLTTTLTPSNGWGI